MNLSAPFLCQFFKEKMHRILPYCDFIFGNETEAAAFAENNGISEKDIPSIAKAIAALPKINQKRKRKVVITQVCYLKIIIFYLKSELTKTFLDSKKNFRVKKNLSLKENF